jgi:DNA-binding NarL/FixJ family response regulator
VVSPAHPPSPARASSGDLPQRLLLVDPHRTFVEALAVRLARESGLTVVATAAQPAEALRLVRAQPVDVAVLGVDGDLGDVGDAMDLAETLLAERPGLALVAVAEVDDLGALARAVRLGFRGWVPKGAGVATLVGVLQGVREGETHIPPALLTQLLPYLLHEQDRRRAVEQQFAVLTARELDVLRAVCQGGTRREIAADMGLSPNTVRTHMQNVLAKLGVHSSLAAVALARAAGIR